MTLEQQPERGPVPLKAIHIVLEAVDGRLTKLTFTPGGSFDFVSQIAAFSGAAITERSVERLTAESEAGPETQERTEAAASAQRPAGKEKKGPTHVIPGSLQTKPVEGKLDRNQKPTAYARMLGHVDGEEGAVLLSTSFHGRTREIALGLPPGSHLTAQGYLHRSSDPERMSTFSVIHLLQYPGKPPKGQSS
jgi:hypothetical protein